MGITLAILGVPLVAPLAVLVFIGGFIPLIGAVVFGGLAVLVTLVTNGPTAALVLLIVLVVGNQIESHILQPFVVGRHVSLHPMAIAVTLTSGAVLAGLPGAIFAVPLVAAVNAAAVELRPPRDSDRLPSAAAVEQT
jgi:predicted PurR-regulated permease PerM